MQVTRRRIAILQGHPDPAGGHAAGASGKRGHVAFAPGDLARAARAHQPRRRVLRRSGAGGFTRGCISMSRASRWGA